MRRLAYLVAFVLALGAVLWFLPADKTVPSEAIPEVPIHSSALKSEAASDTPLTESLLAQPSEEDAASIRGYVMVLETGSGLGGATVKVGWQEEDGPREVEKVTDGEGNFFVAPHGARDYWIEVSHASLVSEERRYVTTVQEDEPAPELVIWMVSGGAISGRVYDAATNEGIAGVKVGLNRKQSPGVTTDVEGRYRLEGLRGGAKRIFLGHAKGYIDPTENSDGLGVSVSLGTEISGVDFSLHPGVFAAIEGKVIDERGNPVMGAEVDAISYNDLTFEHQSSSDKTKADGTFRLTELQVAGGFYVMAKSEGYVSEALGPLGLTADGILDLVLTLRPTGSISGQVVDVNSGRPIADPHFAIDTMYMSRGRNIIGGHSDRLDENGNFEIVDLPPGPYGLFIDSRPNEFRSGIVRPQVSVDLESGEHITDVRLTYDYEMYLQSQAASKMTRAKSMRRVKPPEPHVGEVRGRVVRAGTGDAVTSFHLEAIHTTIGSTGSTQSVHDPEGRFTIREHNGQTLSIEITSKGYVAAQEVVQGGLGPQAVHDITVPLTPGALVEGEVIDTSGKPLAGASVYIGTDPSVMKSSHMGTSPDAVSGPDGTFQLDTLSETTTRIYASHPAFAAGSAEVRPTAAGPTHLRIVLGEGGVLEAIVRRRGVLLAGQSIMILDETGENLQLTGNRTDSQGRYRIDHLAPGLYTIYTGIDEFSRSLFLDAEIAQGMVTEVDFDFDDTGNAIEGTVSLNGQRPYTLSVRAEIRREIGLEKNRIWSSQTGEYILTDLPTGEVDVSIQASLKDGSRATESFTVSITGGTLRHDLDLRTDP